MAETLAASPRTAAPCATCGATVAVHEKIPATFCMECGCCVLNVPGDADLPPLVPPHILEAGAWKSLTESVADGGRARSRSARLLFVPFHEWEPDVTKTRLVKDARAVLSPAADLLPCGLRPIASPLGDDIRNLSIAETAHKGRLADPRGALDLIRAGELVDVMIPPAHPAPVGAGGGTYPRLVYYPFWFFTYAVDHKERVGVVDATSGRPVGPTAEPRRWRPAVDAAVAGLAGFAVAWLAGGAYLPVSAAVPLAAVVSWAAAAVALSRGITRERGR